MPKDTERARKIRWIQQHDAARVFNKYYLKGALQNKACEQRVIFRVDENFCCTIWVDPETTLAEMWEQLVQSEPSFLSQYEGEDGTVDWLIGKAIGLECTPDGDPMVQTIADLEIDEGGLPIINVRTRPEKRKRENTPATTQTSSSSPPPQKKQRREVKSRDTKDKDEPTKTTKKE